MAEIGGKRTERLIVDIICDETDLRKMQRCDWWLVDTAIWNIVNQRGEVRLKQCKLSDI